uniref:Ig-like domain-containing protein n=1 Tax=Cyprinodon variegatus TaxID=28743 RepID=A0A3Q2DNE3_CYPVA
MDFVDLVQRAIPQCIAPSLIFLFVVPSEHQVVVKEGADSVTLPFRTTPDLPGETVVRWWDKKDNVVYVYKNGKDEEEERDKDYRGRAKMKDDLLKTGDLSLTLIKPTKKDSGRYYCGVHHQNIRRKAIVHLKVKGLFLSSVSLLQTAVDEVDRPQNQPEDIGTRTTNKTPLLAEEALTISRKINQMSLQPCGKVAATLTVNGSLIQFTVCSLS